MDTSSRYSTRGRRRRGTSIGRGAPTFPRCGELYGLADEVHGRRRAHAVRTIAFYLPQFHPTPENDQWWGNGFTEWSNVGGGTPLFDGHLQPRRPTALGYYDLRLQEAANAQFELARRYGIDGFCYYYYWFEGRRVLNRPLDDLATGKTGPFPFSICWANEDWTRSWDGSTGEVLLGQNHKPEWDFAFIEDIAPMLRNPDYIRIEGKPILLIYRADKLATPKETTRDGANGAARKASASSTSAQCSPSASTIPGRSASTLPSSFRRIVPATDTRIRPYLQYSPIFQTAYTVLRAKSDYEAFANAAMECPASRSPCIGPLWWPGTTRPGARNRRRFSRLQHSTFRKLDAGKRAQAAIEQATRSASSMPGTNGPKDPLWSPTCTSATRFWS